MAKFGEGDARWLVDDLGSDGRNVNQWHWTEKDISAWAKSRIESLLCNKVLVDQAGLHIATKGLTTFEGDVTLNIRKKKLIPLYELQLVIGWEGRSSDASGSTATATGSIEVPYLSQENHDEDPELRTTCIESGAHAEGLRQQLLQHGKPVVLKALAQFVQEISNGGPEAKGAEGNGAADSSTADRAPSDAVAATVGSFKKQTVEAAKQTGAPSAAKAAPAATSRTSCILEETFHCSPEELYACFTQQQRVLAFTQGAAVVEPHVGGRWSLYGGSVQATFTEMQLNKRLALDWYFNTWEAGTVSKVTLDFDCPAAGTTLLKIRHDGIPEHDKFGNEDTAQNVQSGWKRQILYRIKGVFGYGV